MRLERDDRAFGSDPPREGHGVHADVGADVDHDVARVAERLEEARLEPGILAVFRDRLADIEIVDVIEPVSRWYGCELVESVGLQESRAVGQETSPKISLSLFAAF